MFAAHALRERNSYTYNNNIRAYNIDDLYHTGWINPPDMVKIDYIVCVCMVKINYNDMASSTVINSTSWVFS